MRLTIAALLSAAGMLSALARAAAPVPDPTDPAAPAPAVAAPASAHEYDRRTDTDSPTWQQLNRAVQPAPAAGETRHDERPGSPGGHAMNHRSMHGVTAK